jgi:hypothetical protein
MSIDTRTAVCAVTWEEARAHLRVDCDFDKELIMSLCLACTQMCEHEMQQAIITREGEEGLAETADEVPSAIKTWILAHAATFYENRGHATAGELKTLPFLGALLDPYRTWS